MLRFLTAGESHGPALIGVIEGLPAGIKISISKISKALARRRLGYGRGARMKFEQDKCEILSGVRHGFSQGGPISIKIDNTEWPKWTKVMSVKPVESNLIRNLARNKPLVRPRPGHADLAGMQKYSFSDSRPILERASARETATRVALGAIASEFLEQLGIRSISHTISIAKIRVPNNFHLPKPSDIKLIDSDPLRCFHKNVSKKMRDEVDLAHKEGETLGGIIEILVYNLPPGLGSYVHWDRRLDSKLAAALVGIQAIKGMEIGDGFLNTELRGSKVHDEIIYKNKKIIRTTNRSGGIEGGMSTGEILKVRAAMKPISTVPNALRTINITTKESTKAHHQRSDVCAVPAAGVVAESMVMLTLVNAILEKFGGDSLGETKRNIKNYLKTIDL